MSNVKWHSGWRVGLIAYAPLILWIGVIFFLSSNNGSMAETSRFIGPLLHFLFPNAPDETIQIYHGYIRKCAHFTEYAVLAFFALRAFSRSYVQGVLKLRYTLPVLLVAVVACLDEFNQSFEASRTSSPWDVSLDISGGAVMILAMLILKRPRLTAPSDAGRWIDPDQS